MGTEEKKFRKSDLYRLKRPFGLSLIHIYGPGDFEDYFQMIQDNDKMCGGFVWEWCDHATVSYTHLDVYKRQVALPCGFVSPVSKSRF